MTANARDAFVLGVASFAKKAGLDRDDARQLARLLFMSPQRAIPTLKAASDIQLARRYSAAGMQLVKLGRGSAPMAKDAWNWSGAGTGAGWGATLGGFLGLPGAAVGAGLGGLIGGLFGGGGDGGGGQAAYDEVMNRFSDEEKQYYGPRIQAVAEEARRKAIEGGLSAEKRKMLGLGAGTGGQSSETGASFESAMGQAMPESMKELVTPEQYIAARKRATGLQQNIGTMKAYFGQIPGVNFQGLDPERVNLNMLDPADRPMAEAAMQLSSRMRRMQEAYGGRRAGWSHFGQGGLSAGPAGIRTAQRPIGGAGGRSSSTGSTYTGLAPDPVRTGGKVSVNPFQSSGAPSPAQGGQAGGSVSPASGGAPARVSMPPLKPGPGVYS